MPLDFTNQEPFTKDHCVYVYGRDRDMTVLCQVYIKILLHMQAGEADPLRAFAMNRPKI
jgi:hypothetical protein